MCGGKKIRQSFEDYLQTLNLTLVYALLTSEVHTLNGPYKSCEIRTYPCIQYNYIQNH